MAFLHPLGRIAAADVFHAIGGDVEEGGLQQILEPGALMMAPLAASSSAT